MNTQEEIIKSLANGDHSQAITKLNDLIYQKISENPLYQELAAEMEMYSKRDVSGIVDDLEDDGGDDDGDDEE